MYLQVHLGADYSSGSYAWTCELAVVKQEFEALLSCCGQDRQVVSVLGCTKHTSGQDYKLFRSVAFRNNVHVIRYTSSAFKKHRCYKQRCSHKGTESEGVFMAKKAKHSTGKTVSNEVPPSSSTQDTDYQSEAPQRPAAPQQSEASQQPRAPQQPVPQQPGVAQQQWLPQQQPSQQDFSRQPPIPVTPQTPVYKKAWFWVLVAVLICIIIGVGACNSGNSGKGSTASTQRATPTTKPVTPTPRPVTPTPKPVTPTPSMTTSQKNALSKAKSYLSYSAFSHDGLIKQLEYEQFSESDATWAADNCGADWNAQAAAKAKSYLSYSSFSHGGLVDQLEYEGFTASQEIGRAHV